MSFLYHLVFRFILVKYESSLFARWFLHGRDVHVLLPILSEHGLWLGEKLFCLLNIRWIKLCYICWRYILFIFQCGVFRCLLTKRSNVKVIIDNLLPYGLCHSLIHFKVKRSKVKVKITRLKISNWITLLRPICLKCKNIL